MFSVVGFDPGVTGALVHTVDGEYVDHLRISRSSGKRLNAPKIWNFLCRCQNKQAVNLFICERVGPIGGKDTPTTAWALGGAEQLVVGVAQILRIPTEFVEPTRWQIAILRPGNIATRPMRINNTFAFARSRFPALVSELKLAKNDGIASACCIAEYGHRLHKHGRLV